MKINSIKKLLGDTDKIISAKRWLSLYSLIRLLYPKWAPRHIANKADNIHNNTTIHYEVKDEDK